METNTTSNTNVSSYEEREEATGILGAIIGMLAIIAFLLFSMSCAQFSFSGSGNEEDCCPSPSSCFDGGFVDDNGDYLVAEDVMSA